jgi:hypothetical protein
MTNKNVLEMARKMNEELEAKLNEVIADKGLSVDISKLSSNVLMLLDDKNKNEEKLSSLNEEELQSYKEFINNVYCLMEEVGAKHRLSIENVKAKKGNMSYFQFIKHLDSMLVEEVKPEVKEVQSDLQARIAAVMAASKRIDAKLGRVETPAPVSEAPVVNPVVAPVTNVVETVVETVTEAPEFTQADELEYLASLEAVTAEVKEVNPVKATSAKLNYLVSLAGEEVVTKVSTKEPVKVTKKEEVKKDMPKEVKAETNNDTVALIQDAIAKNNAAIKAAQEANVALEAALAALGVKAVSEVVKEVAPVVGTVNVPVVKEVAPATTDLVVGQVVTIQGKRGPQQVRIAKVNTQQVNIQFETKEGFVGKEYQFIRTNFETKIIAPFTVGQVLVAKVNGKKAEVKSISETKVVVVIEGKEHNVTKENFARFALA